MPQDLFQELREWAIKEGRNGMGMCTADER
jgi:hypothetical protein